MNKWRTVRHFRFEGKESYFLSLSDFAARPSDRSGMKMEVKMRSL